MGLEGASRLLESRLPMGSPGSQFLALVGVGERWKSAISALIALVIPGAGPPPTRMPNRSLSVLISYILRTVEPSWCLDTLFLINTFEDKEQTAEYSWK